MYEAKWKDKTASPYCNWWRERKRIAEIEDKTEAICIMKWVIAYLFKLLLLIFAHSRDSDRAISTWDFFSLLLRFSFAVFNVYLSTSRERLTALHLFEAERKLFIKRACMHKLKWDVEKVLIWWRFSLVYVNGGAMGLSEKRRGKKC